MTNLRHNLSNWRTVIFALYLRELQSRFNDKLGFAWAFFEPFLYIFAFSYLRGLIQSNDAHGIPLLVFMMVGMVAIQSFITTLNATANSITKNKPLYAFRQVQPIASVITALFLELIIKCGVIVLLFVALYFLDQMFTIDNPLLLLFLFVLLWIFTFSVGLTFSVIETKVPELSKLRSTLTRPLFFVSCVFFSLQDIPQAFWPWLTWNPLVHIIELARYACFTEYGDKGVSVEFAVAITLALLFFSCCLYHVTWKKLLA